MKKKYFKPIVSSLVLLATVACSEKYEYLFGAKEPFVSLEASEQDQGIFGADGQAGYGLLRCNARWAATSLDSWLSIENDQGEFNDTLRFRLQANPGDSRQGKIIVYNTIGSRKTDTLLVVQQASTEFVPQGHRIRISSEALTQNLTGQDYVEVTFQVEASTPWRVYTRLSNNWSTVLTKRGEGNGQGSLMVTKNEGITARSTFVYAQSLTYPALLDSIEIKQDGRPLEILILSPANKNLLLDASETPFSFTVKADGTWSIEDKPEWLKIDQLSYEGNAVVHAKAETTSAERSAVLTVRSTIQTNRFDQITVTQRPLSPGRMKDSLALVAIYKSANGDKWTYPWKLELPLNQTNYPGVFFDMVDGELRVIDLFLNSYNLEGSLPNEIGWLTELVKLNLSRNNKLTGPLPVSIGKLTKLRDLRITSCRFTGEFPDISDLQELTNIEMEFNRFEGEFPVSFSTLPKLKKINIKYNKFNKTTCVPKKWGGWRLGLYINPQREVDGDKSSEYNLVDCAP